jgi:hypothetical protein
MQVTPGHYAQQVANLLGLPVEATRSSDVAGGIAARLSEGRTVFSPVPPELERVADGSGGVRLVSLPPELREQVLGGAEPAAGGLEAEVFLPVFEDDSLGMFYPPHQAGLLARAHPVPARFIAAALAPALAGRPFVIRPVPADRRRPGPGRPVRRRAGRGTRPG